MIKIILSAYKKSAYQKMLASEYLLFNTSQTN